MSFRPLPKAVIAGSVLLVAACAALLLWRGSSSSTGGAEGTAGAKASPATGAVAAQGTAQAGATGQAATAQEKQPAKEQIPVPGCWEGTLAFDQAASLDTFRAALAEAVAAKDRHLATYLQERLTELVGNDASKALQVLKWAEGVSQPELGVYMEAIKASQAVHQPEVAEQLLKMGEDKGSPLLNRAAALDTLETQRRLSPTALQRLKALALDETVDSVAWVATRTMGRVMKEDFERTGTYAPYWKELLDVGSRSEDMAVRLLALEMPSYSNPILDSGSIDKLGEVLRKDPERDVREMAAFRLAVTEDPPKALEAYKAAFAKEHDLCVRWAMLRFAVRAAGADALPVVAQFAQQDPRLKQDYLDFKELYAAGTVDFARIWLGKKEHHDCLMEEGAPH
jgi:hypothetical protein